MSTNIFFDTSPNLARIVELNLSQIHLDPNQPRKTVDEVRLQELANSISSVGLINPITVKKVPDDDGYIVVSGERRYRAHQILGRERIQAIIIKGDNADEIALIENVQREDLKPLE